jgi:hypothetical protein
MVHPRGSTLQAIARHIRTLLRMVWKSPLRDEDEIFTHEQNSVRLYRIHLTGGNSVLARTLRSLGAEPTLTVAVTAAGERFVDYGSLMTALSFVTPKARGEVTRKWDAMIATYRSTTPPPEMGTNTFG